MSSSISERKRLVESAIDAAVKKETGVLMQLASAEFILEAAYEEAEPYVDQDPRFLRAQRNLQQLENEYARRTRLRERKDLIAEVTKLATKFGELRKRPESSGDPSKLSDSELQASARAAYKAIGQIRTSITAMHVAPWRKAADDARNAAAAIESELATLRAELDRLTSEQKKAERRKLQRIARRAAAEEARKAPPPIVATQPTPIFAPSPSEQIRNYAQSRGITELVHFTRIENLASILQRGLIPRADLEHDHHIGAVFNDGLRLEKRRSYSCMSITHLNFQMFHKYSKLSPEAEWCIISFDVSVMWRHECLFCATNAATAGAIAVSESLGWSKDGLERLFDRTANTVHGPVERERLMPGGLPANRTSHPQAEVLVRGRIDTEFIRTIAVKHWLELPHAKDQSRGKDIPVIVNAEAFAPRRDYAYWKKYANV
jgi:hypothetical protein